MTANNSVQIDRLKSILIISLIIIFLLPNCASPPGPAIRRVGISEPTSPGKGWRWDESKKTLVYETKGESAEKKEGDSPLPSAVKEVTPPPATEKTFIKMEVKALSRKDFIKARFPGKKVFFPEELKIVEKKLEYRVGPDDVLQVIVWNQPDLSMDVLVRKDGSITMPLLGNIRVEGLTIPEIEELLRRGFAPYVEKPNIIVNPKEINSLRISIVGRIKKPDISIGPVRPGFILRGGNTLLEILSDVEVYPDADLGASYVLRGDYIIPVDLKGLLKDGDYTQNILLEPGDKIVVPGPMKEITILGEVRAPDKYKVNLDTTLLDALSIAKGINKDTADLYMAYVARNRKILPVNLKRLLDWGDLSQNMILEDGDVIYVPNINEKKFYVLGEVARPGVVYFNDPIDIVEALAQAGGFLTTARRSQVVVVRGDIRQPQIYEINLLSLMEGKSLERFTLQKGDIVYIPRTAIADWNVFLSQILPTLQAVDIIDVIRSRH